MTSSLHHPSSAEQAVALVGELGDSTRFVAGGTDLIVQINKRRRAPKHLINLHGIHDLSGIHEFADHFVLGALTTHKAVDNYAPLRGSLIAIPEAARLVGGHQIRNRGTVGGNIANASPAADLVVPLLALDGKVTLKGPEASRVISLEDFFLGPGRTVLRNNELIVSVEFAKLPAESATCFIKLGRRRAMEISTVCVAAGLTLDSKTGVCLQARIAMGAVNATATRVRSAEQMLQGNLPDAKAFREAGRLATQSCRPISDLRSSAEYRRTMVEALVPRALQCCLVRLETIQ